MLEKNNKRTINGWAMYDWANSVYPLVITTAIFPSYFYGVTGVSGSKASEIDFLGLQVLNTTLYTLALSVAFMLVAIMNPFLSSLADVSGNKKRFMQLFCTLGAMSCSLLYFFTKDTIVFGVFMFMLAGVGFAGSLVFYNSFLPEIATEEKFDKVSAKGFSLGYIGSVILLVINLVMIQKLVKLPDTDNYYWFESTGEAVRYSFLSVGIWWFGFSLITFSVLPNNVYGHVKSNLGVFKHAKVEFTKVWNEVKQLPLLRKFLLSFLFYSMGVQTIMYVATIFGEEVIKMKMSELITLVLILQIVAIGGAWLIAKISSKKGNIFAIKISIVVWGLICLCAYFMEEGMVTQFYILGVFVGLMMGAIQSMSRSTYAKFIPMETKDHASYFSFFETVEKFSISIGALVYAVINQITKTQQASALALVLFFIIGFIFIYKIPSKQVYNTTLKNEV